MASTKKQKVAALPKSKAKTAYGLLSEVRKLILAEPKRYDQTWWLYREGEPSYVDVPKQGYPSCGMVACVAGWIVTLKGKRARGWAVEDAAADILGNDVSTMELFGAGSVKGHVQTVAHAKAGAAHIRRFQEKYAKQLKAKAV